MPDLATVQEFVGTDFTAEEWDEIQEAQNRYYLELAQDNEPTEGQLQEHEDDLNTYLYGE